MKKAHPSTQLLYRNHPIGCPSRLWIIQIDDVDREEVSTSTKNGINEERIIFNTSRYLYYTSKPISCCSGNIIFHYLGCAFPKLFFDNISNDRELIIVSIQKTFSEILQMDMFHGRFAWRERFESVKNSLNFKFARNRLKWHLLSSKCIVSRQVQRLPHTLKDIWSLGREHIWMDCSSSNPISVKEWFCIPGCSALIKPEEKEIIKDQIVSSRLRTPRMTHWLIKRGHFQWFHEAFKSR